MPKIFNRNCRGDTIVEVMISMAILALVLGAAYATSTRSLRTGTDAGQRSQALSYAQQQVEILKTIGLKDPSKLATYKVGFPFCINPVDASLVPVDPATGTCALPVGVVDPANALPYSVVVNYYDVNPSDNKPDKTFIVSVKWESGTVGTDTNSSSLQYKPQDSFVDTPAAEVGSPAPTESAPVAPNLPTITLTANPTAILAGSTATISWSIAKATTCSALAPSPSASGWAGSIPVLADGTSTGSRTVGAITADTNFPIRCTRTGAGDRNASVTVGLQQILTFTKDASPIPYNTSTTLRWTSAHTTSCNLGPAPSGNRSTGNLTATTTFNLTCAGPGGTTPASATTVTVNNPPPSITSFYASPSSIGYGGGTTLIWTSNYTTSCSRGAAPNGSQWTGALYSSQWFSLSCSGPGGSTSADTYVSVAPPPPPPPPPCSTWAGGDRSGDYVWLHASGSGCGYYYDTVVGWNGGFSWNGPHYVPGCYEHTQYGGTDPWGWLSSSTACP